MTAEMDVTGLQQGAGLSGAAGEAELVENLPSLSAFQSWLDRWDLFPDGPPILTATAQLLPVRSEGSPAILKLALDDDECRGAALMAWWTGEGAARVLARDDTALLLERAMGPGSLSDLSRNEHDDDAIRVLCAAASRLHSTRRQDPPALPTLARWFRDLEQAGAAQGGILNRSLSALRELLSGEREITVLHGDLHHGNVLDFGPGRGWLAIDPKALIGERGFDFATMFLNPDLSDPSRPVATDQARFLRRLEIVARAGNLERTRLLRWILAWSGLSCVWSSDDTESAGIAVTIARFAAAELDL